MNFHFLITKLPLVAVSSIHFSLLCRFGRADRKKKTKRNYVMEYVKRHAYLSVIVIAVAPMVSMCVHPIVLIRSSQIPAQNAHHNRVPFRIACFHFKIIFDAIR